ncbi:MAG: 2-amino-4-hydroxy-6-hydroxymethyldihydropteridine diphosphokinase [Limisphaerales bacterium]
MKQPLPMKQRVIIALGSNLGDSRQTVIEALDRLKGFSTSPLRRSSLWRTTPVDCPPGSPGFLNAVVALDPLPRLTPETLLIELQALEREFGRRPKQLLNEARPLDLDIIAWGDEVRRTSTLVLPHPRAHLRRFVLQPLSELAPTMVLPGQTQTVAELLAVLKTEERLERAG